jgi:L-lysine 6-transaminase
LTDEFKEHLFRSAVNKPSNSDFYTSQLAEFVQAMGNYAIPEKLPHMFLISGGALAVENAFKTAFDWKTKLNMEKGVWKGDIDSVDENYCNDLKIIHFKEAFHGRSGYTLSTTNTFVKRKYQLFPKFEWPRIDNPKIHFPIDEREETRLTGVEDKSIQQIYDAIEEEPENIAGIIIEPIQGEGGDNHFRERFLKKLRQICDWNDILLIYDEIQTGLGLTGKMWCYQNFKDCSPDILCFGKKTQVCGIFASDRINNIKYNVFSDELNENGEAPGTSRLNSTWGGNLVDMVRATKYLEIIDEENLIENARKMGEYLLDNLKSMAKTHNYIMNNIRGKGLMVAFDTPDNELQHKIFQTAFKNHLLILKCGEKSIRFRPHLDIDKTHIDKMLEILDKTLLEIKG